MEPLFFPALVALAGGYFLIRNILHLKNEEQLQDYIDTSPKAKLWVKKFSKEKTIHLTKKYFLPLEILASIGMLAVGIISVLR